MKIKNTKYNNTFINKTNNTYYLDYVTKTEIYTYKLNFWDKIRILFFGKLYIINFKEVNLISPTLKSPLKNEK